MTLDKDDLQAIQMLVDSAIQKALGKETKLLPFSSEEFALIHRKAIRTGNRKELERYIETHSAGGKR